jgi:hypothetical protein
MIYGSFNWINITLVLTVFVTRLFYENQDSYWTTSVVYWSEFLAADPEVPSSIPGATRFSEYQWVWNGFHSASK